MMIVLLAFSVLVKFYRTEISIYVNQNSEKYGCFANNECTGAPDNPIGSLFEAMKAAVNSSEEVHIIMQNEVYYYNKTENDFFMANLNESSYRYLKATIDEGGQVILEGQNGEIRKKIIFVDCILSLEVGMRAFMMMNLEFQFQLDLEGRSDVNKEFFIKVLARPLRSVWNLINITLNLNAGSYDNLRARPLFYVESNYFFLKIERCSFLLNENRGFNQFIVTNFTNPDNEADQNRIIVEKCSFDAKMSGFPMHSIMRNLRIEFRDCLFQIGLKWGDWELESTSAIFSNVSVKTLDYPPSQEEPTIFFFFKFTNSNIIMNEIAIIGEAKILSIQGQQKNITFSLLTFNNSLKVNKIRVSNISILQVYRLESANTIEIFDLSFINSMGNAVYLGKANNFTCEQAKYINNQGGNIALISENSILILNSRFEANRNNNGSNIFASEKNKNLTIVNSLFLKNTAKLCGGSIFFGNFNSNLQIWNSSFESNSAYYGGALWFGNSNQNVFITDSRFNYDSANGNGSAIRVGDSNRNLFISFCTFEENESYFNGSVIWIRNLNQNLNIAESIFSNNKAPIDGGAITICNSSKKIIIYSSSFIFNEVPSNGFKKSDGGAVTIKNLNENLVLASLDFRNNKASFEAGALFIGNENKNSIFYALTFSENMTPMGKGGALCFGSFNNKIYIISSTFYGNSAMMDGGAVLLKDSNKYLTIFSSTFRNNVATEGGAVWLGNLNQNIFIVDSIFFKNEAYSSGGALLILFYLRNLLFLGTILEENISDASDGGALYLYDENESLLFFSVEFESNAAMVIGGAISMGDKNNYIVIMSSVFQNNSGFYGGVISIGKENSELKIVNSTFCNNTAHGEGGGLRLDSSNEIISISRARFENNYAAFDGAAIYISEGNRLISIIDSAFSRNYALRDGGTLTFNDSNTDIWILSSNFSNQTAANRGGVILLISLNQNFMISNCSFSFNEAYRGGVLFSDSTSKNITLKSSFFFQSKAEFGAILVSEVNSEFIFISCFFQFMNYSNSVFQIGRMDNLKLNLSDLNSFWNMFPNAAVYFGKFPFCIFLIILPQIFQISGTDNFLNIAESFLKNIPDYFINDYSEKTVIVILRTVLKFEAAFQYQELFFFKSRNSNILFKSTKVIIAALTQSPLISFLFSQKIFSFAVEKIYFDFEEKLTTFIMVLDSELINLTLRYLILRKYKGNILNTSTASKSTIVLTIFNSEFSINSSDNHFLVIQNDLEILIKSSIFLIGSSYKNAALYFFGDSLRSNITIIKSFFQTINKKHDFYFRPKSDSEFCLLHSLEGFNELQILGSSISIGTKNIKCILNLPKFSQVYVHATFVFGNFLNQKSSLFVTGICEKCSIFFNNSKIEKNRAVFGGLLHYEYFERGLFNSTNSKKSLVLVQSKIRDNSASFRGGHFYINSTKYHGKDFSNDFIEFINTSFRINTSNDFDHKRSFVIYFEGVQSNLLRIQENISRIYKSLSFVFKMFLKQISVKSPVISYKVFTNDSVLKISKRKPDNLAIYSPVEVVNAKKSQNGYYFCLMTYDALDQNMSPDDEVDFEPSINRERLISYIQFNISSNFVNVNFTFYKGIFCANRFYFDSDYVSLMGREFNFTLGPHSIMNFIPSLIEKTIPTYLIIFKIYDCKEGELFKDNECVPCLRNSYLNEKVIGTLMKCILCTDNDHFNCYGGNMRSPKESFWRISNYSNNYLRCPSTACLGDPNFAKNLTENDCLNCFLPGSKKELLIHSFDQNLTAIGFCKFGYQGNLCSKCIRTYGSNGDNKCADCNYFAPYLKQGLISLVKLLLFYFSCFVSIKSNATSANGDRNLPVFINSVIASYLLQTFFMYLSVINVLKMLPLKLGDFVDDFISYFSGISPTENVEIFSFECLLKKWAIEIPAIFFKILMNLCFFSFSLIVLIFMFLFQHKRIPGASMVSLLPNFKGIFLTFFLNNLILFLGPEFRILFCVDLGDEKLHSYFLLSDLSLECNSSQHKYFKYYISIPLIIVFVLIIPGILLINLISVRNSFGIRKDKNFLLSYGYFVSPYKQKTFYFEIVSLLNKIVIILFKEVFMLLTLTNNQTVAPGLLLCYLLVYYSFIKLLAPYELKNYWLLNKMSLISLKLNISNAFAALTWTLLEDRVNSYYMIALIVFYLIVTNLMFFLYWGWNFGLAKKEALLKLTIVNKLLTKLSIVPKTKHFQRDSDATNNEEELSKKISIKELLKENQRMKILIKLLIKQTECPGEEGTFIDGMEEGRKNIVSQNNKFFSFKRRGSGQEANHERLITDPVHENNDQTEKQDKWAKAKSRVLNYELISKKLKGNKFYDYFLQFKFRFTTTSLEMHKTKHKLKERFFSNTLLDKENDWVATTLISTGKRSIFYIYLRKVRPWTSQPFSENLKFTFFYQFNKIQVEAEIFLQDFIRIESLKWQAEGQAESSNIENLLISRRLEEKIFASLFEHEFKKEKSIRGDWFSIYFLINALFSIIATIIVSCPFLESNRLYYKVTLSRDGEVKIFGLYFSDYLMNLLLSFLEST